MKDKTTKKVLCQGEDNEGVYSLFMQSCPLESRKPTIVVVVVVVSIWH